MDVRDDWARNPLHANPALWHGLVDRRIEKRTLESSSAIVLVTEASRHAYAASYPRLESRMVVITNGVDVADLPNGLAERQPAGDIVRFLHAGSLRNPRRRPIPFFKAFGQASAESNGRFRLQLLGIISPEHRRAAIDAIASDNLEIGGFVPHEEAVRRMTTADVLVVVTSEEEAGAGTMTGKIFECLALGRPILLVAPDGPAADLIRSTGAGVVADPLKPTAIADAIFRVAAMARDRGFAGAEPEALARFDRRTLASDWSRLLLRLTGAR